MCKSKKKKNHSSKPPNIQRQEVLETQVPEQIGVTQNEEASLNIQKTHNNRNIPISQNDNQKKHAFFNQPIEQIKNELGHENKNSQLDSPESSMNSDRSHSSSSFSAIDVPSDNGCSPFENIDKGENASISERSSPQDTQLKKQSYQYWRHHDQHKYYLAINNKNFEQATNNSISQNIKNNNLHTIVVSILATAGIALGVSTAVQLEISIVRIAIGACCLVAAAAMYYSMPKSLVENSKVEEVSKKWLTTVIP